MSASPTRRDFVFGFLAIGLVLLAVGQVAGGAWWLIVEGDPGVLSVTPIVVLMEGVLAASAWRRTCWTKHPIVPGRRQNNRTRALAAWEVVLTRASILGAPWLALGWLVGWWNWTLPAVVCPTLAVSWLTIPPHQRRQVLGVRGSR
jgi:hypothetical protein